MKNVVASLLIALGLVLVPVGGTAFAIDLFPSTTCDGQDCGVVKSGPSELSTQVQNIINMALYLIGGIAVIMIIVGGIRMATAQGDPGNVKAGRLAIIWSVVGVAVTILASAIVNFVVNWNW